MFYLMVPVKAGRRAGRRAGPYPEPQVPVPATATAASKIDFYLRL